ncbi:hypothetical protein [Roseibium aquae]|uniref:hypothetical protein n=1 Tax=Roseibium aquae TaxID=1323746 RepID=UPI001561BD11|nr:hypothetical protein [Roseibium aquae]
MLMRKKNLTPGSEEPLNIARSPFAMNGPRSPYRENILLASGIGLVLIAITMVVATVV